MTIEELKPIDNHYRRWPVSKRVNSSKADSNDPTLIDRVTQAARSSSAQLELNLNAYAVGRRRFVPGVTW
jgi:hypothetical protein